MSAEPLSDASIVESWQINAQPWTVAVREGQIESRKRITNQAMIDAVAGLRPRSVLDLGCGEGWLARELSARRMQVVGTDVIPELIEEARRAGGGNFHTLSYEELAAGKLQQSFDVVACNFALIGKTSVESAFKAAAMLLDPHGAFVVQTLHPLMACGDLAYEDGWREGSWAGFSADFSRPAPWYFRTLGSWIQLFVANGFVLREMREPLHPATHKPASIILIGKLAGSLDRGAFSQVPA